MREKKKKEKRKRKKKEKEKKKKEKKGLILTEKKKCDVPKINQLFQLFIFFGVYIVKDKRRDAILVYSTNGEFPYSLSKLFIARILLYAGISHVSPHSNFTRSYITLSY